MRARALLLVVVFVGVLGIGGLASVHTSGVVVPPSYVGRTAVAGAHGPWELTATAMTVGPPEALGAVTILRASLSADHRDLSGAQVDFYLGTGTPLSLLCATTTGNGGEAVCPLRHEDASAARSQGFTASYTGDADHGAATASWLPTRLGITTGPTTTIGTGGPLSGTAYTVGGSLAPHALSSARQSGTRLPARS